MNAKSREQQSAAVARAVKYCNLGHRLAVEAEVWRRLLLGETIAGVAGSLGIPYSDVGGVFLAVCECDCLPAILAIRKELVREITNAQPQTKRENRTNLENVNPGGPGSPRRPNPPSAQAAQTSQIVRRRRRGPRKFQGR